MNDNNLIANGEKVIAFKKLLLVIDANPETRKHLIQLFTQHYIVNSTDSCKAGLKIIKKYQPDVVLADITTDELAGISLCKAVKDNENLNHIAVVLLSGLNNSDTHLQAITVGADDFSIKPFNEKIVVARVASLLKSREQLRRYYLNAFTVKEATNTLSGEHKEFLSKCIKVVEANIENENFTMKNFSQAMGISYSVLYKKIKTISGQTVNAFIRTIKLRRAALMMLTENINIAQAGLQVGIENQRYFRQQFVKLFGVTPSQYIKSYKKTSNQSLDMHPFTAI